MEILVVGAIIVFILIYNNTIDKDKFFADNQKYLEAFKEDDYQFLVYAKYGEDVDLDQLYSKRVTTAFAAFLIVLVFSISGNASVEIINSQFFDNSSPSIRFSPTLIKNAIIYGEIDFRIFFHFFLIFLPKIFAIKRC